MHLSVSDPPDRAGPERNPGCQLRSILEGQIQGCILTSSQESPISKNLSTIPAALPVLAAPFARGLSTCASSSSTNPFTGGKPGAGFLRRTTTSGTASWRPASWEARRTNSASWVWWQSAAWIFSRAPIGYPAPDGLDCPGCSGEVLDAHQMLQRPCIKVALPP